MERKISEKLELWKIRKTRKPLIVRWTRQVGKTYSVIEFGKNYFTGTTHVFNLEKYPELHSIFDQNFDIKRIKSDLELFMNQQIVPGNDLLFFDEIQECPRAITALRYFYEEIPELHVIAAGSLLEFAMKDISFPLGRLEMLYMQPMSFSEFLVATDKGLLTGAIGQQKGVLSDVIIGLINSEMYKYFIIGGMPECVLTYVETGSIIDVIKIQADLIATYRQDFSKYAGYSDKRCLNSVLTAVARRTGEQIKYSRLDDQYSNPTLKKAFNLLETARLFKRVNAASPEGVPLKSSA